MESPKLLENTSLIKHDAEYIAATHEPYNT